jgi:hypothetical protein
MLHNNFEGIFQIYFTQIIFQNNWEIIFQNINLEIKKFENIPIIFLNDKFNKFSYFICDVDNILLILRFLRCLRFLSLNSWFQMSCKTYVIPKSSNIEGWEL